MKTCKKCLQEKSVECFTSQKDTKDGLRTWCKDCVSVYTSEWKRKQDPVWYRNHALKQRYGITSNDFEQMHNQQDGLCAICKITFPKIARVDHCHETGEVRGLLCDRCNITLAFYERFKNEPELVESIEKYLSHARSC